MSVREEEYETLRAAMIWILERARKPLHADAGHFCDHRAAMQAIKDKAKIALGATTKAAGSTRAEGTQP